MKRLILIIAIIGLTIAPAWADLIVNTGTPTSSMHFFSTGYESKYASEFTINQAWTVTSIYTYILDNVKDSSDTLYMKIYSDGGDIPGTSLYAAQFTIPSGTTTSGQWLGPTGLNWTLSAGTYWVAVEGDSSVRHEVGSMGIFSPSPLANDAMGTESGWSDLDDRNFGWQINANPPSTVPIPAAVWLLGSGLIGLFGIRRFRK